MLPDKVWGTTVGPTIGVVDDDLAIREAVQDLLRSYGYRTCAFRSAEDYLDNYSATRIDCLILDMKMPGLSGVELQLVLNAFPTGRPPIIFMTSHWDQLTRSSAYEGGAHDFLTKPVDDDVLLASIKSALAVS